MKIPIFCWRGFKYIFKPQWYSLYRWRNLQTYSMQDDKFRLIDIGAVSIGYRIK
jgi:hypothetical protein